MKKLYVAAANAGNLMFRMMFAEHLRRQVPDAFITGTSCPEFGISLDDDPPKNAIKLPQPGNQLDVPRLVEMIKEPQWDGVLIENFALRLDYFEDSRDHFIKLFDSPAKGQRIGSDEIVIHVRAGDILGGIHGDYWPVPIPYLRAVVGKTGLKPVITGQLEASYYTDALYRAFPNARFLRGNHWLDDFQTLRYAENIATSVSTFAWLAAWLSETAKRIYLPQLGLLNPLQRPDVNLSPKGDPRYVFTGFPVEKFNATPEQIARIAGTPVANLGSWGESVRVAARWMEPQ